MIHWPTTRIFMHSVVRIIRIRFPSSPIIFLLNCPSADRITTILGMMYGMKFILIIILKPKGMILFIGLLLNRRMKILPLFLISGLENKTCELLTVVREVQTEGIHSVRSFMKGSFHPIILVPVPLVRRLD